VRHLNTWGKFRIDDVCGVVTCSGQPGDAETSLRFAQALEILRSCGMDFHVAVPEDKQPRPWWRSHKNQGGSP
jgi:hypothetical protein